MSNEDIPVLFFDEPNLSKEALEVSKAKLLPTSTLMRRQKLKFNELIAQHYLAENIAKPQQQNLKKLDRLLFFEKDLTINKTLGHPMAAGSTCNWPPRSNNPRVRYIINNEGDYCIDSSISNFDLDACNIKNDNISLNFRTGGRIQSTTVCREDHRDAIQIIPAGNLHFAGGLIDGITITSNHEFYVINSTGANHKLQGITGFDGLFQNINLSNLKIKVYNTHGITFYGLHSGSFSNIKIDSLNGIGKITLNPLRICGGGYPSIGVPTIWIVDSFVDEYGNVQELYLDLEVNNVTPTIIDNRLAFSDRGSSAITQRFWNSIPHQNVKIYSKLKLQSLWDEVLDSEPYRRVINTGSTEQRNRKTRDFLEFISLSVQRNAEPVDIPPT